MKTLKIEFRKILPLKVSFMLIDSIVELNMEKTCFKIKLKTLTIQKSNSPTETSASESIGMMRYWRVLVDSLTWPGMSLSLVKMHILFPDSKVEVLLPEPLLTFRLLLLTNCLHILFLKSSYVPGYILDFTMIQNKKE